MNVDAETRNNLVILHEYMYCMTGLVFYSPSKPLMHWTHGGASRSLVHFRVPVIQSTLSDPSNKIEYFTTDQPMGAAEGADVIQGKNK